ncbi:hypothetical protein [Leptolyngbya sp. BL0902]|uniref:hypothetical protein n=1 Tax=Leptolyngbya sp. BL0902 TaxID=1115757 RepID=UPI0018E71061|nr:hypothetical protein [Leptolyngbya sp. BL0902]
MASLPNLDPSRPTAPHGVGPHMLRPPQRPVSFDLTPRTSALGRQGPQPGEAGQSPQGLSLPLGDVALIAGASTAKRPTFSRHRHDANPALALKVLQDIHLAVESWHSELRQTVQIIQNLYLEGPIVDGWLEATDGPAPSTQDAAALLRHADPQALSGYVDRLCESQETQGQESQEASASAAPPSYRLCSLNADGQLQCMPCPPEQVSTLSLAIARHQKLRQLVDQKRYLEAKLKRAVEVLTSSRDGLGITPQVSSALEGVPRVDGLT